MLHSTSSSKQHPQHNDHSDLLSQITEKQPFQAISSENILVKMKTATITSTIIAFSTLAAAAPGWDRWVGNGKGGKKWHNVDSPFDFSSTYSVVATPDQVIGSNNQPAPGQPGAVGYYNYGINAALDTICYNITLVGVTGAYQSPARTATHIHQANKGLAGPPRIAFPNPVGDDNIRRSVGCLTGPFVTGILSNGTDTGAGFKVSQIEANPANFFTDVHTTAYVPGAVRGQLA